MTTSLFEVSSSESEIRADERRQICEALIVTGRGDAAEFIETAFRTPECPTCHGSGEIGFNNGPRYAGGRDPQNDDYAVCPDCGGTG